MTISKVKIIDLERIVGLNRLFHLDFPEFDWDTPKWIKKETEKGNYYD